MSTIAADRVRAVRATPTKRIPLTRITAVELRKMFDTRSGFWLIASIAITSALAAGGVILWAPEGELTYSTFATAIRFPVVIILPLIAILSVTSEWSQRTGLTTFTLVPHRGRIITAKAISAVTIAIAAMVLAFAVGALGNLIGAAVTGEPLVWDVTLTQSLYYVLGMVLSLLTGFMLGVLIRSSTGAIVAYFILTFLLPTIFGLLASSQQWFFDLQPWVDIQFAQAGLFVFEHTLTGTEWAHIAVTGVTWLLIPLLIGLGLVLRSEVK
jgi:ABC-2 type transport system permease protein